MVGALKKWLGIDVLERENLTLANSLVSVHNRLSSLRKEYQGTREELAKMKTEVAALALSREKHLTSEPAKPKIVLKQRVNWKQFRSAAEKANDPEREEA